MGSRPAALIDNANRAGLRAFVSLLFGPTHTGADLQVVKFLSQHGVSVKIDFTAFQVSNESVTLIGKHANDEAAYFTRGTGFCLPALFGSEFLQLLARGLEGASHDRTQGFVEVALASIANCRQLVLRRNRELYPHTERTAAPLVLLRLFHGNPAADYVWTDFFKLRRLLPDQRFDPRVFTNVPESHLQRCLHDTSVTSLGEQSG
jgi:hypothetical protein